MSKKEKLTERFAQLPKDFTFDELVSLLGFLGFEMNNKGNTSGSRVMFEREGMKLCIHRPHPGSIMKVIVLKEIYKELRAKKLLWEN
ncbi:MAG: type II toxin-antitoxin system HicA family toxin [Bacteroidales bacterium]|nr:type II toxin-antitoxin system HicA family toxin [Bacteroidales bacterium]